MRRRPLLGAGLALLAGGAAAAPSARVRPGQAGWPLAADWAGLSRDVGGRLSPVTMPALTPDLLRNPFALGEQPALTQSSGWVDAWSAAPSAMVVEAAQTSDVVAAVRFAAQHRLRLVIRGGGHSYSGGSSAPDSLLLRMRGMDAIQMHAGFIPAGCATPPEPAVSFGAGCLWLQAYDAVTVQGGRYVQGGGCTTVGVAGMLQGGGFGSFSKRFGLVAASLLEAEVVTADGAVRVVNACQEPDLFWALKGGGGGTFGVVTRVTLRTHDLPATFGAVQWSIPARDDAAMRALLAEVLALCEARLCSPDYGEQLRATPDNRLSLELVFQDLDPVMVREDLRPLVGFVAARAAEYPGAGTPTILAVPARRFWDEAFLAQYAPAAILRDATPGHFWWAGDAGQVGAFWHGYESAWLPYLLLLPENRPRLAEAWFQASRHWGVSLHLNKGLAGAAPGVIEAARDTPMNPDVVGAFALAIIAGNGKPAFGGASADELARARANAARIKAAHAALRQVAPDTGSYCYEAGFAMPDWQRESWGENVARLAEIKRRYDPEGLFVVHHGIGSEGWSADGFTPN